MGSIEKSETKIKAGIKQGHYCPDDMFIVLGCIK